MQGLIKLRNPETRTPQTFPGEGAPPLPSVYPRLILRGGGLESRAGSGKATTWLLDWPKEPAGDAFRALPPRLLLFLPRHLAGSSRARAGRWPRGPGGAGRSPDPSPWAPWPGGAGLFPGSCGLARAAGLTLLRYPGSDRARVQERTDLAAATAAMRTEGLGGLERFSSPGKGRGLRALQSFQVGDLLFCCPAYACVLSVSERGHHCEHCFAR